MFMNKILPTLGIIGGGQLAKMMAMAASRMSIPVIALHSSTSDPVASLTSESLIGEIHNVELLKKLANKTNVITLENEFIDAELLLRLEHQGVCVYPSSTTISLVQDKLTQKQTLTKAALPVVPFMDTPTLNTLEEAGKRWGYPFLLKTRRNGYDGKGNITIYHQRELLSAWEKLKGDHQSLFAEKFCDYEKELAVIVSRSKFQNSVIYPVVDTFQQEHVCHKVIAPSSISISLIQKAKEIALRATEAIQGVGSMGIELFLTKSQDIIINEIAPRVHNTGHYTIEGCFCSQFENHIRAILGWPLGDSSLLMPFAVLFYLFGNRSAEGTVYGMQEALSVPGVNIHLYGKQWCSVGRKMGHITALGRDKEFLTSDAMRAAEFIQFGGKL